MPKTLDNLGVMAPQPPLEAPLTRFTRHCVICGNGLPPRPDTGRPRLTCSLACLRVKDHRDRKIQHRLAAMASLEEALGCGFPHADGILRREIARLKAEVAALRSKA